MLRTPPELRTISEIENNLARYRQLYGRPCQRSPSCASFAVAPTRSRIRPRSCLALVLALTLALVFALVFVSALAAFSLGLTFALAAIAMNIVIAMQSLHRRRCISAREPARSSLGYTLENEPGATQDEPGTLENEPGAA